MNKFKCHLCTNEYDSYVGLSLHCRKTHHISNDTLRIIVYNNGEAPLCKCGCGETPKWNYREEKFNGYKHGHHSRVNGGFYSPEGARKSGETRKRKLASGELVMYNKGRKLEDYMGTDRANQLKENISNNKERSAKISAALTGKEKSPEHREKMKKQLAINRRVRLTSGNKSKPERIMEEILIANGIPYTYQYELSSYHYDFHIHGTNILIEVDGDFWHCKPGSKYEVPKMKEQVTNMNNDKIKKDVAKDNGYTLLRFWESDIQNNRLEVVKILIENLQ